MDNPNDDLEVIDVEHYHDTSDKKFSHSSQVHRQITKCLELGSKEPRNGWFNERMDKQGFLIRTYVEDTRQATISAVKWLMALMLPDYDEEATKDINQILENLREEFNRLDKEEDEEFYSQSPIIQQQRMSQGIYPIKGNLNKELPYFNAFIDYQYDTYRKIFGELNKLASRLDYWKSEDLEA